MGVMDMVDLLKEALEAFPNFIVIDEKGIVVYINGIYAKLLGIKQIDAIGKHVKEIIPNTRLDIVVKSGKEEIGSLIKLYDKSRNEEVTLVCNRIPIIKNNKVIGAAGVTTINNFLEFECLQQEIERMRKENQSYKKKLDELKSNLNPFEKVIGKSTSIKEIKKIIEDYADSNLSILINGETGVGKEVFAKAIHQMSNRALNNYVKINCAAIPKDLLESELFGYVEGAFSGAVKGGKIGKFELADNGTLLLDEIGEMSLELQAKLLRVLQEKELEKVGSVKTVKLNVRVICTTNKNIEEMVQKGQFREDLYYRINVIELTIPPLRERLDDIVPLANHFIDRVNKENNYHINGIDKDVIELFNQHCWPGNVREFEHTIERASILCKEGTIQLKHCKFLMSKIRKYRNISSQIVTLEGQTRNVEKEAIINALEKTGGNKSKAAKLLNIDRGMLYYKLKKYDI